MNMKTGEMKAESKVEMTEKTLDRTIGFISNCDTKASIMLALFGVLLTVICTSNITKSISDIVKDVSADMRIGDYIYMGVAIFAIILSVISIILLIRVLSAKVDKSRFSSKIYFKDIVSYYNITDYIWQIQNLKEEDYLKDLTTQVYINAEICSSKYEKYNLAIKLGIIGFAILMVLYLIGKFVY